MTAATAIPVSPICLRPSSDDELIARLRASRDEHASTTRQEGREVGLWWAREWAEHADMARIEDNYDVLMRDIRGPDIPGDAVESVLNVEDVTEFWGAILEDRDPLLRTDRDWVAGFIDGLMDIWKAVKPRL